MSSAPRLSGGAWAFGERAENRFDTGLAAQIALVTFWSVELLLHRYQQRRPVLAGAFSPLFCLPQIISMAFVRLGTDGQ